MEQGPFRPSAIGEGRNFVNSAPGRAGLAVLLGDLRLFLADVGLDRGIFHRPTFVIEAGVPCGLSLELFGRRLILRRVVRIPAGLKFFVDVRHDLKLST